MLDLISSNAYRILGLPGSAKSEEIQRQTNSFMRSIKLGVQKQTAWDHLVCGSFSRSERDVLHAQTKLSIPTQRIQERFYWFHHEVDEVLLLFQAKWENFFEKMEQALNHKNYLYAHDLILVFLLRLHNEDPVFIETERWVKLLQLWHATFAGEPYWWLFAGLEEESGLWPSADPDEHNSLHVTVTDYPKTLLVQKAEACFLNLQDDIFHHLIYIFSDVSIYPDAKRYLIQVCEGVIEAYCAEVLEQISPIFEHQKDMPKDKIVSSCNEGFRKYQQQIEPRIKLLLHSLPLHAVQEKRVKELGANTLKAIAFAYTWADDFLLASFVCRTALKLMDSNSSIFASINESYKRFVTNAIVQLKEKKMNDWHGVIKSNQFEQTIVVQVNEFTTELRNMIKQSTANNLKSILRKYIWLVPIIVLVVVFINNILINPAKHQSNNTVVPLQTEDTLKKLPIEAKKPVVAPQEAATDTPAMVTQFDPTFVSLRTNGLSNIAVDNTKNDSDVRVKLFYLSAGTAVPVRQLQIRKGDVLKIEHISPGTYDLRFQNIRTKQVFKTESIELTEVKGVDGISYSDYSITLYTVLNGNTTMIPIQEKDF